MDGITRGALARRCGVNPESIRYYESRGLLSASRTPSNYRIYDDDAVRRVRFIKRAQELGFTLKEIRELLLLQGTPGARCVEVVERARGKIQDIDERIRALRAMRDALNALLAQCSGRAPITDCPILEALDS
jgi:MerR family mercuric resistance operon transcriptional regulator